MGDVAGRRAAGANREGCDYAWLAAVGREKTQGRREAEAQGRTKCLAAVSDGSAGFDRECIETYTNPRTRNVGDKRSEDALRRP